MKQAGAIFQFDARERLATLPRHLPILLIHGRKDRMVDYSESTILEEHLPQARRYIPTHNGQPTEAYGHTWYDYFGMDTAWVNPISAFLDAPHAAKL